jgi:aminoglycoside 3-N-acetyltransferase I
MAATESSRSAALVASAQVAVYVSTTKSFRVSGANRYSHTMAAVSDKGAIFIHRLGPQHRELARATFTLISQVFGEAHAPLSDAHLDGLLARPEFLAFAATDSGHAVGGLTGHVLPMTAFEGAEVFLYDIAVAADHRRRGIGRRLVDALRREASNHGIGTMFVPADDEDTDALRFYTALGGTPQRVTFFEFGSR